MSRRRPDRGLTSLLAVCCLLLLAPRTASAMEVGESVHFVLPDVSFFPEELQTRQFTCRAVTDHAFWLVQDTTFIDLPDTSSTFQLVWGDVLTEEDLDSLVAHFEGSGVDVYGTVASLFGEMPETVNEDEKIWILLADYRDYYPNPAGPDTRIANWVYVWPEDFDGDGNTANDHDIFYVNVGSYKNMPGSTWEEIRQDVRRWAVASGLGQLLRIAHNPQEEKWLVRGLGVFAHHMCYGITSAYFGYIGLIDYLGDFETAGGIELTHWMSGQKGSDFAENLGASFLWLKYVEQREGSGVITSVVQSDECGMFGIAKVLDPAAPDSSAVEEIIFPLYEDWLVTNLISAIDEDFEGGLYHYGFLDGTGYDFSFIGNPASFVMEFYAFPIPTWIANAAYGMTASSFSAQFVELKGYFGDSTTVYLNGMYNQNDGSGYDLDGRWVVYRVVLSDDSTVQSVDSLELSDLYSGTFELEGSGTYLALTNNNPGGTAWLRFTLSQDTDPKALILSALQNTLNQEYVQVYASLYRLQSETLYGFDWVGPLLEVSHLDGGGEPDSTAIVEMDRFYWTIWSGRIHAWESGTYELRCSGYDSLGVYHEDSGQFAVGFGGSGKLLLDIEEARLEVPAGSVPPGALVSLAQGSPLGISISTSVPLSSCGGFLTGLLAGPVSIPAVQGLLSFSAETPEGSVYRLCSSGEWERLSSYWQTGRIYAAVEEGGTYILGQGPGAISPRVSAELLLHQASPNPSDDHVTIGFSLPASGAVTLRLFDLSGRLVTTLVAEDLSAGEQSVIWDGRSESGVRVSPGVYFCRLEAQGQVLTQKLMRVEEGGRAR